jgi:hypothetical protein
MLRNALSLAPSTRMSLAFTTLGSTRLISRCNARGTGRRRPYPETDSQETESAPGESLNREPLKTEALWPPDGDRASANGVPL